uniref:Integrase catalytic domain-containing protein n=1 Tax=Erpetoichthys calabaricus TaxID=27687 RepID=A0A8C4SL18_ERPCA
MRCQIVQHVFGTNPKFPLKPHPVTQRPYQKVGADLFTCDQKDYLIVTDYYSLYPEVCGLSKATAENVIVCMKSIFSRHGVPEEVFTDNGLQFSNASFKAFADSWEFFHNTSSPHFPQSSGLVEKSVGIVKKIMCKAKDCGGDFYKALLAYHSSPLECGYSPAYLLLGRRICSNLPVKDDLLYTWDGEEMRQFKEKQQTKQKMYFDRGTQQLPELCEGDSVRFKDNTNTWTQKGIVIKQAQPRSYHIQTEESRVIWRN